MAINNQDMKEVASKSRYDYFRCPVCGILYSEEDCEIELDKDGQSKGFVCPSKCERPYNQPPYESPLNSENDEEAL